MLRCWRHAEEWIRPAASFKLFRVEKQTVNQVVALLTFARTKPFAFLRSLRFYYAFSR